MLIDDLTHYVWTFPLRAKSDVFQFLVAFHAYIQTQFNLSLLALQSDNGKEFDNHALRSHCAAHGIALRLSCPYTFAQNGKAERIIRTLNDCIRSLLLHAMPSTFWVEALSTATYLINRRPCQTSGTSTPHELLLGAPPEYSHLRVFGCLCFPNQSVITLNKLSARSTPCALLGYPQDHRGYRCLDLQTRRVITSRHVVFDETRFPFLNSTTDKNPTIASTPTTVSDETVIIQPIQTLPVSQTITPSVQTTHEPSSATSTSPSIPQPTVLRPPTPPTTQLAANNNPPPAPTITGHPMQTRSRAGIFKPNPKYALVTTPSTMSPIPKSVRAALQDLNWRLAMAAEHKALLRNRTWRLVDRSPGANVVTGEWIFKHKLNRDGSLERYKARWVV